MGKNVHSKSNQGKKLVRKMGTRFTQSCGDDGVHCFGRIGSLMGIVTIALMVAACLVRQVSWARVGL